MSTMPVTEQFLSTAWKNFIFFALKAIAHSIYSIYIWYYC